MRKHDSTDWASLEAQAKKLFKNDSGDMDTPPMNARLRAMMRRVARDVRVDSAGQAGKWSHIHLAAASEDEANNRAEIVIKDHRAEYVLNTYQEVGDPNRALVTMQVTTSDAAEFEGLTALVVSGERVILEGVIQNGKARSHLYTEELKGAYRLSYRFLRQIGNQSSEGWDLRRYRDAFGVDDTDVLVLQQTSGSPRDVQTLRLERKEQVIDIVVVNSKGWSDTPVIDTNDEEHWLIHTL